MNSRAKATTGEEFVISRVFEAPRATVYGCFTDAKHLRHWWGPKGFTVFKSELDLRVGGMYHYGMKTANGQVMWGRFVFRDIVRMEKLVFISSFSDEQATLQPPPFPGSWPVEMLSTFLFEDVAGGKTKFTVKWSPHNAGDAEKATFAEGNASMTGGWTGTLDRLEAYLRKR